MSKEEAIFAFYSTFGLPAYDETSVPTDDDAPALPYITYNLAVGSMGSAQLPLTLSLWYRDSSWEAINAKTEEISVAIGRGGKVLRCDDGAIWLMRGEPFAQSMGDDSDDTIRRKVINLTADFFTAN